MDRFKKIIVSVMVCVFGFVGMATFVIAGAPNILPGDGELGNNKYLQEADDGGTEFIGLPGIADGTDATAAGDTILNVIKSVINWSLGILGLLALVIILYAGFLMLFSFGNDDSFSKGWKILKYAAIGLLVIGLAWLLVTLVFWFVGQVTGADSADSVLNQCNLFAPDGGCIDPDYQGDINLAGTDGATADISTVGDSLLNVIKSVINWVLGILGLVVLVIVLYAGFMMLLSMGDDEKFNKGWKILKTAAIALLVIGLAWFIVTMIFWFIGKVSGTGEGGGGAGTVVNDCNLFSPDENGDCRGNTDDIGLIGVDSHEVGDNLLDVIKGAINWILGILALIALIIVLYAGFLMLTAMGEDDKYKKGWTIMKYAAIGLIMIGIAWFIVTMIFWLVGQVGGPAAA